MNELLEDISEAITTTEGWRAWCRRVNDPQMTDEECDLAYARLRALVSESPYGEMEGSS